MINSKYKFTIKILDWFNQHGRKNLPWQKNISPYRVWISEIMLQQTQVATVIPYFQRFIKVFPTIKKLAQADIDSVLSLWTGLGYYARARNIHKTAKIIEKDYKGKFPSDLNVLQTLPGIGRSTAGAILAIAFEQDTPILDGNVKRVLTRFHAVEGWSGGTLIQKKLWELATQYTPKTNTAAYTQAIMDLGATVCTRSKPLCHCCPLQQECQAYQQARTHDFPYPNPKLKKLLIKKIYMILPFDENKKVLLQKRPPVGIWGGLWSFPEINHKGNLTDWCFQQDLKILKNEELQTFRHTFSHFHLDIIPILLKVKKNNNQIKEGNSHVWFEMNNALKLGLASPVKKLLLAHCKIND